MKQQQLQRHQNLMKNLQICLAHGPDALAQSPAPAAFSALETKAENKNAASAQGTCDCFKLKQKVADAKMALENSSNGEQVYKRQYEKAAALLKATQKKLQKQRLRKRQPTQRTLCDQLKTCSACSGVDGCAWCGSSLGFGGVAKGSGMCRRVDVNARLRGHPKMDGLTSGECDAKAWQTKVDSRASVLSFNVFASDLKNARRRARTVFSLVKRTNPTFIAFQEVEDWFLQALKLEPWTQTYYQSDFGSGHAPGGLYILSKYPLSKVAYNEQTAPGQVQYDQRARVLTVNAVINQTPPPPPPAKNGAPANAPIVPSAGAFVVTFATTTLDWRSADSRTDGLDFVFATLSPYNDVILTGDFNFDHGALPETSHIPENWLDVWPALNPDNLGHTWDPDTNRYARSSDPTSRPSRIDRVLVKSVHWLPRYMKLVGCSSADLLCQGLFAAPQPIGRPHPLPQPLSQPHASTEANSPPLTALAKPKARKPRAAPKGAKKPKKNRAVARAIRDALGKGRSANSVFLELSQNAGDRIAAATTSWAQLEAQADNESEVDADAEVDAEAGAEADAEAERAVVIPSNHYGLLTHFSRFIPHCQK
jgi:endonuclease/exonuclease/phosphatase family metal-dependent hydrolase